MTCEEYNQHYNEQVHKVTCTCVLLCDVFVYTPSCVDCVSLYVCTKVVEPSIHFQDYLHVLDL